MNTTSIFAILPEHDTLKHLYSDNILFFRVVWVIGRVHEENELTLVLPLQFLKLHPNEGLSLGHHGHLESRINFGWRAILVEL